jgi:hypothetical protein
MHCDFVAAARAFGDPELPSGPAVIPYGPLLAGAVTSVMLPAGVIVPILPPCSANERLPSESAVMKSVKLLVVGMG